MQGWVMYAPCRSLYGFHPDWRKPHGALFSGTKTNLDEQPDTHLLHPTLRTNIKN